MQSETGFPSSHHLKSYVASKSRLKLAARCALSADAGLLETTVTVAITHSCQFYASRSVIRALLTQRGPFYNLVSLINTLYTRSQIIRV